MRPAEKSQTDLISQWVTFFLDGEMYGVNVLQVQEVLRVSEIAPVPGAPEYVLGIINLRGNIVTVIDTRQRFGLGSKELDDLSRIVIIEVSGNVIGILVDGVAEVVYLRESSMESAPNVGSGESSRYIQGVCNRENQLLILVDLNKLLADDEWKDVSSL